MKLPQCNGHTEKETRRGERRRWKEKVEEGREERERELPQEPATNLGEFKHLQLRYHPVASFKDAQGRTI